MNPVMKRTLRIAGLAVLLVLILCLTAQAADAASYKRITLEEDWENQRVKVGNRYFWMEGDDQLISVNGGTVNLVPTTFEWAEEIDANRAEASLQRAQNVLSDKSASQTDIRLAQARLHRALVRKSVASDK